MNEQFSQYFGTGGQQYINTPGVGTNGAAIGQTNVGGMSQPTPANWNRPYIPQQTVPNQFGGQQPQIIGLPGRVVSSYEEIGPQDVPMNGMVYIFPKSDYSEIYAKCWNNEGKLDYRIFTLKQVDAKVESSQSNVNSIFEEILSRLEKIEEKLNHKPHYNKPKYNKHQEVTNNG